LEYGAGLPDLDDFDGDGGDGAGSLLDL